MADPTTCGTCAHFPDSGEGGGLCPILGAAWGFVCETSHAPVSCWTPRPAESAREAPPAIGEQTLAVLGMPLSAPSPAPEGATEVPIRHAGPKAVTTWTCETCIHVHGEYYARQGDHGYDVSCKLAQRAIGDTTWRTPGWCPLLPAASAPPPVSTDGERAVLDEIDAKVAYLRREGYQRIMLTLDVTARMVVLARRGLGAPAPIPAAKLADVAQRMARALKNLNWHAGDREWWDTIIPYLKDLAAHAPAAAPTNRSTEEDRHD